jgi:glycerol-3-phosphate acyltransferase PlsX
MKKPKIKAAKRNTIHIGIDLMGSDTSPIVFMQAAYDFIKENSDSNLFLCLFGTEAIEKKFLLMQKHDEQKNLIFHRTKTPIFMHDNPLFALRRKKNSSMIEGMKLLKNGDIDAFISAGNTGALMGSATMVLPRIPGIDRAALLAIMPTQLKEVAVLDVGANLSMKAEQFIQYALLGIAFRKFQKIEKPTLGLLNIGTEEKKGTAVHQKTYEMLQKIQDKIPDEFVFLGNIEGKQVFEGDLDLLITDGFTGNVFLKTAEGFANFVLNFIQKTASKEEYSFLQRVVGEIHKNIHYAEYPGALLIGLNGIVVKCHGDATAQAMKTAIQGTLELVKNDCLGQIKKWVAAHKEIFK